MTDKPKEQIVYEAIPAEWFPPMPSVVRLKTGLAVPVVCICDLPVEDRILTVRLPSGSYFDISLSECEVLEYDGSGNKTEAV